MNFNKVVKTNTYWETSSADSAEANSKVLLANEETIKNNVLTQQGQAQSENKITTTKQIVWMNMSNALKKHKEKTLLSSGDEYNIMNVTLTCKCCFHGYEILCPMHLGILVI